jgi:transcription antitermination factor NusB
MNALARAAPPASPPRRRSTSRRWRAPRSPRCSTNSTSTGWARRAEIDAAIGARLASGWTLERLDRPMRQILRVGAYELIARPDVPTATVISEYVDVADAFYDKKEKGFVNGVLDGIAKAVRV